MTSPTDDRDLEEYLAGGSEISRRYKALSQEQPPRALDRAVLIDAEAAPAQAKVTPLRARRTRWMVPFAAAATVLLSVAIFRDAGMNSHVTSPAPAVPAVVDEALEREVRVDVAVDEPVAQSLPAPRERTANKASSEITVRQKRARDALQANDAGASLAAIEAPAAIAEADKQEETKIEPPPLPAAPPASAPAFAYVVSEKRGALSIAPRPAEKWLSDLRKTLDEGRKEEVRAELKRFIDIYPTYFRVHPEAARPFAEFKELLPADEIIINKSNSKNK